MQYIKQVLKEEEQCRKDKTRQKIEEFFDFKIFNTRYDDEAEAKKSSVNLLKYYRNKVKGEIKKDGETRHLRGVFDNEFMWKHNKKDGSEQTTFRNVWIY
jgi:hypothetical protein